MPPLNGEGLMDIEVRLLLEGVFLSSGFDFRSYEPGYLKERVLQYMQRENLETVSALQNRVLHDPDCMGRFLQSLAVGPASVFHEPRFFSLFRRRVMALLRPLPAIKVWVAGCANGAETYSLAILLREAELHRKVRLYATHMNEKTLAAAQKGVIPMKAVQGHARNYRLAGGKKSLATYFAVNGHNVSFRRFLQRDIIWGQHNLVTDASFNQFHCILCRNVLGSFGQDLRKRVHKLLYESLTIGGLLGLGGRDHFLDIPYENCYEPVDDAGQWYRKTL